MSSLEFNKIAGAVLVGGIVTLLTGLVANRLFMPNEGAPASEASAPAASAPAIPEPVSPLLAAADAKAGETIAKKCLTCHTFEKGAAGKVGPNLWGVVNAQPGQKPGFAYSAAMTGTQEPWSYEHLNRFLTSPRNAVKGTKMSFAGLPKVEDRAAVIAYLRTLSDNPAPLPTEAEIKVIQEQYQSAKPVRDAAAGKTPDATQTPATQQAAATVAPIAERLKTADAALGEKTAKKCTSCHTFDKGGPNRVGPNLWGIVGNHTAHAEGFAYSKTIAEMNKTWDYEALDQFLTSPKAYAPGTKMSFVGIKDPSERAAVIAYLRGLSDNPVPLPQ